MRKGLWLPVRAAQVKWSTYQSGPRYSQEILTWLTGGFWTGAYFQLSRAHRASGFLADSSFHHRRPRFEADSDMLVLLIQDRPCHKDTRRPDPAHFGKISMRVCAQLVQQLMWKVTWLGQYRHQVLKSSPEAARAPQAVATSIIRKSFCASRCSALL